MLVAHYYQFMVGVVILCLVNLLLLSLTCLLTKTLRIVVWSDIGSKISFNFVTKEVRISILKGEVIEAHWPAGVTLVDGHQVLFYFIKALVGQVSRPFVTFKTIYDLSLSFVVDAKSSVGVEIRYEFEPRIYLFPRSGFFIISTDVSNLFSPKLSSELINSALVKIAHISLKEFSRSNCLAKRINYLIYFPKIISLHHFFLHHEYQRN